MKSKLNNNEDVTNIDLEYTEKLNKKIKLYDTKPKYQIYPTNKEYKKYKQTLWDVKEEGKTMPSLVDYIKGKYDEDDEDDDFNRNGQNEDDDDDELVITEQQESIICPITKKLMSEPLVSKRCGHSYSSIIKDVIRDNPERRIECPVAGCVHFVTLSDLEPNKSLARKIRRKKYIEMEEEMERDDDDEE